MMKIKNHRLKFYQDNPVERCNRVVAKNTHKYQKSVKKNC